MTIKLLEPPFGGQEHAARLFHPACALFPFHLRDSVLVGRLGLAVHHLHFSGRNFVEQFRDLRVQLILCFHSGSSFIESASRLPSTIRSMS
jgi:hypothetical protein